MAIHDQKMSIIHLQIKLHGSVNLLLLKQQGELVKLGTDQSESCLFLNGRAFPRPSPSVPGCKNVQDGSVLGSS